MPQTNYLNITIASQPVDVGSIEDFPLTISYVLEDSEDFQKKPSDTAFDVELPATLPNQRIANSFHDPASEDLTVGEVYRSHQPVVVEADGNTLLAGKAFLEGATHTDLPIAYKYNFYGANGDWVIDLKEKTLYDFLSNINFIYTVENIVLSWEFDGTKEALPYVFAPVKYRGWMDNIAKNADGTVGNDDNVLPSYLRPAISQYWILYWAFKSLGYRIKSDFLDSEYFRRMVMPWTWGNFLQADGTKMDVHKFRAKSVKTRFYNHHFNGYVDLGVTNVTTAGAFDNNKEYSYVAPAMIWEYKPPFYGRLEAHLSVAVNTTGNIVGSNSSFDFYAHWFYYNAATGTEVEFSKQLILSGSGRNLLNTEIAVLRTIFAAWEVNPGDKIICRLSLRLDEGKGIGARVNFNAEVLSFQREFFRIPFGGTIDFTQYTGFKNFKFLDFLSGIVDQFNLSVQTDSINKIVYMEPTHAYATGKDLSIKKPGYFVDDFIDWEDKGDLSKTWEPILYSDYEREIIFRYKNDTNDGILKVVQDRNLNIMAGAKYLLPDRFKSDQHTHENRFFAPTMHYNAEQFASITGIAPQFVCIIPENVSNTSNTEAENTFAPKSCYYKGYVFNAGGWKFNNITYAAIPYMFAVNYQAGGENDPVLSYCDENIGTGIGIGLMKRFFSQRLAIMRNGQYYTAAYMRLKDIDVSRLHREFKIVSGQRWELVSIDKYQPLKDESTACSLRKWVPVTQADFNNSFPSVNSVLNSNITLASNDIKYARLVCLTTDIKK